MSGDITIEKPIPPLPNFCCRCGTSDPKSVPAMELLHNPRMINMEPIYWVKLDKDNEIEHTLIDPSGNVQSIYVLSHKPFFQVDENESVICATCAKKIIEHKIRKKIMEEDGSSIPGIDNIDDDFDTPEEVL